MEDCLAFLATCEDGPYSVATRPGGDILVTSEVQGVEVSGSFSPADFLMAHMQTHLILRDKFQQTIRDYNVLLVDYQQLDARNRQLSQAMQTVFGISKAFNVIEIIDSEDEGGGEEVGERSERSEAEDQPEGQPASESEDEVKEVPGLHSKRLKRVVPNKLAKVQKGSRKRRKLCFQVRLNANNLRLVQRYVAAKNDHACTELRNALTALKNDKGKPSENSDFKTAWGLFQKSDHWDLFRAQAFPDKMAELQARLKQATKPPPEPSQRKDTDEEESYHDEQDEENEPEEVGSGQQPAQEQDSAEE